MLYELFFAYAKKAPALWARINCQDQRPAEAGRGWPAGEAMEIIKTQKPFDPIVFRSISDRKMSRDED